MRNGLRFGLERRGGFALPMAVFALVIVGVLVTGGFYMARQETRIGVASKNAGAAFYLAETGIYNTLATWNSAAMSVGAWNETTVTGTGTNGTYSVKVMPMSSRMYFLQSTGTVTSGGSLWSGATRQVGLIARIQTADLNPPAALTTIGSLKFGGNAIIDGRDTNPSMWPTSACAGTTLTDKPGIMIKDSTQVNFNGNESGIRNNQLFGSTDLAQDASMSSASLTTFGDMTWSDLTSMADKHYTSSPSSPAPSPASGATSGTCNTGVTSNWGEPLSSTHPCFNYFPIIWLDNPGQTWSFSGGEGQGILLVEGDLKVTGQFQFYGPIYIKGHIETSGGGGVQHFHGGMIAANADLDQNSVLGTADIVYSTCAVTRAIMGNSALTQAKPLAQRSWVDLSNIAF